MSMVLLVVEGSRTGQSEVGTEGVHHYGVADVVDLEANNHIRISSYLASFIKILQQKRPLQNVYAQGSGAADISSKILP